MLFTLLTPRLWPGLRLDLVFQCVLYIVFLASFALSSESQASTFFIVGYSVRSTFQSQIRQVPRPAFLHLVVPEVRDRPHFLLRTVPGSLHSQVPRLVCVCEVVNVHDLQDRAPFVRQSKYDTLPCGVDVFPCTAMSEHDEQTIVTPYFLKSALVT